MFPLRLSIGTLESPPLHGLGCLCRLLSLHSRLPGFVLYLLLVHQPLAKGGGAGRCLTRTRTATVGKDENTDSNNRERLTDSNNRETRTRTATIGEDPQNTQRDGFNGQGKTKKGCYGSNHGKKCRRRLVLQQRAEGDKRKSTNPRKGRRRPRQKGEQVYRQRAKGATPAAYPRRQQHLHNTQGPR